MSDAPGAAADETPRRKRLGAGRSGEVWLIDTPDGREVEKVFFGDTLANLVHYVFTGAPNPYIWNEDAVRGAFERRHILAALMPWWFGEELGIAQATGVGWDEHARVFTLRTEYVDGSAVPLLHPFRPSDGRLPRLAGTLMPALQRLLRESGFDGLVWQAGRGNPVALNNYLVTGPAEDRFVFIDAESGVPALFPLNPVTLFSFYLPMAVKYREPMFDHVDIARLRDYLRRNDAALADRLDAEARASLMARVDRLEAHQARWTSMRRAERGIAYQLVKGRLTSEEAGYYRRHTGRWYIRETRRVVPRLASAVAVRLPRAMWSLVRRIDPGAAFKAFGRFVSSQAYRTQLGEHYVRGRVEHWRDRGQLRDDEAERLFTALASVKESSRYLTDFGAHLGMKASFLALELTLLGLLALLGVPLYIVGLLFVLDGPVYRSIYTAYRGMYAVTRRAALPWVAFLVGLVPLLGTLAFPAQMMWSANGGDDDIARFIVYDTFSKFGARVPIWGGTDTATEHVLNRVAARLIGGRAPAS
jgi:hypothetical protein